MLVGRGSWNRERGRGLVGADTELKNTINLSGKIVPGMGCVETRGCYTVYKGTSASKSQPSYAPPVTKISQTGAVYEDFLNLSDREPLPKLPL